MGYREEDLKMKIIISRLFTFMLFFAIALGVPRTSKQVSKDAKPKTPKNLKLQKSHVKSMLDPVNSLCKALVKIKETNADDLSIILKSGGKFSLAKFDDKYPSENDVFEEVYRRCNSPKKPDSWDESCEEIVNLFSDEDTVTLEDTLPPVISLWCAALAHGDEVTDALMEEAWKDERIPSYQRTELSKPIFTEKCNVQC